MKIDESLDIWVKELIETVISVAFGKDTKNSLIDKKNAKSPINKFSLRNSIVLNFKHESKTRSSIIEMDEGINTLSSDDPEKANLQTDFI